jgi:DNA-binding GntR family transcriptional regulator
MSMTKLFDRNNLKYQQVKTSIESVVDQLEPGDKIPSERELAKQYDCNFLTVRKSKNAPAQAPSSPIPML